MAHLYRVWFSNKKNMMPLIFRTQVPVITWIFEDPIFNNEKQIKGYRYLNERSQQKYWDTWKENK